MKNIKARLIVLGAGGSGMSAALSAWENGLRDIVILEKNNAPGGNSLFPPPPFKNGVPDVLPPGHTFTILPPKEKADQDLKSMMDWTHCQLNVRLVRALTDRQEEACKWTVGKLDGRSAEGWGRNKGGTAKLLQPWCEKYGIPIYTGAEATALVRDENGSVVGLKGTLDGEELAVACDAVVLATGGFLGNPELMSRFFPFCGGPLDDMFVYASFAHDGGGLRLALSADAALDTCGIEWGSLRYKQQPGSGAVAFLANYHHFSQPIWITPTGERFVNEGADQAQIAALSLPGARHFAIFDAEAMAEMKAQGLARKTGGEGAFETILEDFEKDTAHGLSRIAGTLEEAAAFIGAEASALKRNLGRYNRFCEKGQDEDFGRDPKTLRPVLKPPYYVMRLKLSPLLTKGPVAVDAGLRVMGKAGAPIPGLYAAGAEVGGVDCGLYNPKVMGHSMRWAVTSGLIAGESAADDIKNKENSHE